MYWSILTETSITGAFLKNCLSVGYYMEEDFAGRIHR